MPNGCHVGVFREALFANGEVASAVTGALRAELQGDAVTLHVQLMPGRSESPAMAAMVANAVGLACRPAHLRLWSYETFPFGMRVDYERKFRYYDPDDGPRRG